LAFSCPLFDLSLQLNRLVILANGLEVLLISDLTTDKAAAAMSVNVGHLSDPEDIPGLAHFCEHLLFMGSKKVRATGFSLRSLSASSTEMCRCSIDQYPAENDYTEFLTQHSGSHNAYTSMDQTSYHFDIQPAALSTALDRFAQFFISPSFHPSRIEREASAVHSEYSNNLQSDMRRFFQLNKSLSSASHAYCRFGTGTKETLYDGPLRRGQDVRKRLIEWWEKNYSANLCKLAVIGKGAPLFLPS
jgi:insulysin